MIVVSHTDRDDVTRIILARKAEKPESREYDDHCKKNAKRIEALSKEWEAVLEVLEDEYIDYSDIPRLDESFLYNAVSHQPNNKTRISIRIDNDIVEFLKKTARGIKPI